MQLGGLLELRPNVGQLLVTPTAPRRERRRVRLSHADPPRPRPCGVFLAADLIAPGPEVLIHLAARRGGLFLRVVPRPRDDLAPASRSVEQHLLGASLDAVGVHAAIDLRYRNPAPKPNSSPAMPVNTGDHGSPPKPRQTTFARRTLRSAFISQRCARGRSIQAVPTSRSDIGSGMDRSFLARGHGLAHRLDTLNVVSEAFLSCSRCYGRTGPRHKVRTGLIGVGDAERPTCGVPGYIGRATTPDQ